MAAGVKRIGALLWAAAAIAQAQSLPDPTRPPQAPLPGAVAAATSGPVLQSVLLPRTAPPVAIIDGQRVELGQRLGDARLTSVSETGAVLEGATGRIVLKLTPAAGKRIDSGRPPAARTPQGRKP